MPITLVGAVTHNFGTNKQGSITLPAGSQQGDYVIALFVADSGAAIDNNASAMTVKVNDAAGYALPRVLPSFGSAGSPALAAWGGFLTASPASLLMSSGDDSYMAHVLVFRGVHPTTPLDAANTTATGDSNAPKSPANSSVTDGAMHVLLAGMDKRSVADWNAPTGWTAGPKASGATVTPFTAYLLIERSGTQTPGAFTGTMISPMPVDKWKAAHLILRPSSGGSGTPPPANQTGSGAGTATKQTGSGSGSRVGTGSGAGTASAQTGSGTGTRAGTGSGAGTATKQTGSGTASHSPAPAAPITLFGLAAPAVTRANDATAYTLGTHFSVAAAGTITGVRYYRHPEDAGAVGRQVNLWADTVLVASAFTPATGSGWLTGSFATPVNVVPGVTYTASYETAENYVLTSNYFTAPKSSPGGEMTAPVANNGGFASNGTGSPLYPGGTFNATNYWVDAVFVPQGAPINTRLKRWNGTAWVAHRLKVWNGSAWVEKPLKRWNGTAWV